MFYYLILATLLFLFSLVFFYKSIKVRNEISLDKQYILEESQTITRESLAIKLKNMQIENILKHITSLDPNNELINDWRGKKPIITIQKIISEYDNFLEWKVTGPDWEFEIYLENNHYAIAYNNTYITLKEVM